MKKNITLVLLFIFVSVANGFNLDSLLIKSVGGEAALETLKNLKTYQSKGKVTLNDQKGEFLQYFVPPNKYYLEVNLSNFSMVQAYDGKTAWQIDLNNQVSEINGVELKELLKNIYFESFSYLFPERLQGEVTYMEITDRENQRYHKVAFSPYEDDTLFAFYDIEDGLRKLTVSRMDQIITITHISDYRTVLNLRLPFYSDITVKETMFSMIFEADIIEINQPIDLSIFELPDTKIKDYYFPENVKNITIPFEYRLGHIRLPLVINGTKKVWVILDSGASASIFHKPAIDKLDLKVIGKMPAMGVSGFNEVDLIQSDSVQIGNLTLYNHVAGVIDLGKFSNGGNNELDFGGIIGYDFLSRFPVLINYQESTLTVYNPEQFEPPEGGEEIGFHLMMQVPTIEGEILGIKGNFLVDLGNSFGLIIHKQFALQNRLEEKLSNIKDNPHLLGGVSTSVSGKNAFASTFKIGNILIQSLRVLLPDSSQGITGSSTLAGNIGNLVLENFTVLFDYQNSRLFFYQTDSKIGNKTGR